MKLALLGALCALLLLTESAGSAQTHDVYVQGKVAPRNMPSFDHGYLVVYDWDHQVDVFGPDGALMYRVAAQAPGSDWTDIMNGAVDSDGTLVAAVSAHSVAWRGGIATFDPTGAQMGFFDTGDYLPTQVDFGPDHSIWALGYLGTDSHSDRRLSYFAKLCT